MYHYRSYYIKLWKSEQKIVKWTRNMHNEFLCRVFSKHKILACPTKHLCHVPARPRTKLVGLNEIIGSEKFILNW